MPKTRGWKVQLYRMQAWKVHAQNGAHEGNDFSFKTNKSNALTAFPDSAWALQPVLRQVTLLAGIRADRATFITFPAA
ncbi:hypothetical protein, partial [Limnohabitans sp.]|uniref:hypothetical protein n=1 Tax=Limnohabitans sp. TaxID=1907725 RepID=UPI0037C09506